MQDWWNEGLFSRVSFFFDSSGIWCFSLIDLLFSSSFLRTDPFGCHPWKVSVWSMTQIIREGPKRLSKYSGRSSKVLKYWKPEKILFIIWTRSEIQEQLKDIHVMISHGSWTRCCVFSDLFKTNAYCSCSHELGLFWTLNPDFRKASVTGSLTSNWSIALEMFQSGVISVGNGQRKEGRWNRGKRCNSQ